MALRGTARLKSRWAVSILREISSKTMEATKIKGLYFIGEVLDVVGWLGGYNFQWAWSLAAVLVQWELLKANLLCINYFHHE